MFHVRRFPPLLVFAFLAAFTSKAQAPLDNGQGNLKLSGTWLLTGIYFASGKSVDPSIRSLINSLKLTINGANSGSYIKDVPMNFGNNNQLAFSCRGTITAKFTLVRVESKAVIRVGPGADVPGKDCRGEAGKGKSDPEDILIVEMPSGDTMRTIDAGSDTDLEIDTYKRINP